MKWTEVLCVFSEVQIDLASFRRTASLAGIVYLPLLLNYNLCKGKNVYTYLSSDSHFVSVFWPHFHCSAFLYWTECKKRVKQWYPLFSVLTLVITTRIYRPLMWVLTLKNPPLCIDAEVYRWLSKVFGGLGNECAHISWKCHQCENSESHLWWLNSVPSRQNWWINQPIWPKFTLNFFTHH